MAWLTEEELRALGFSKLGKNILISDKASIYNPSKITIGSNVRIDDYCVLSAGVGGINIGSYIHLAVYSCLIGAENISLADFSNISSRVSIYSSNDDYSGVKMTNPMVPSKYTGVTHEKVYVGKHVIIGSGSVILPGVSLEEGAAIAALSLVNKNCEPFQIYGGVPAKKIKERYKNLLEIEKQFIADKFSQA